MALQVENYGSNFAEKVRKINKPQFVMFYTPWCQHYLTFKAEWERLEYDHLTFTQVNCVENRDVCQEENIREYPTFRLYKDGEFNARYKGPRDTEKILKWLDEKFR